jgi:hypothetical protein
MTGQPDATTRRAEAEARKAEADARAADAGARKAEAEARATELTSLVPDLSKVKDSTLTVGAEGPAIGGSVMTFGALASAAKSIADTVLRSGNGAPRVLVTSDAELASGDATYRDVSSGLTALTGLANELLATPIPGQGGGREAAAEAVGLGVTSLAAVATAVPQLLSLISAERSLSTAAITFTNLAAAAAVAGDLAGREGMAGRVVHDDFRLLPTGGIRTEVIALEDRRRDLLARKLHLAGAKDAAGSNAGLVARIVEQQSLVDSLLASIDAFTTALRVVPTGGRRSPLTTAALHELLHVGGDRRFTHVLLVKAGPAQSAQLTDDRPLMFADRFSILVEVNVTYMLLATDSGAIVKAGSMSTQAAAHGSLGDSIRFAVGEPSEDVGRPIQFAAGRWSIASMRPDFTPPGEGEPPC